jgi:hypothetical protein
MAEVPLGGAYRGVEVDVDTIEECATTRGRGAAVWARFDVVVAPTGQAVRERPVCDSSGSMWVHRRCGCASRGARDPVSAEQHHPPPPRDSCGGAEIELRDEHADPDLGSGLTPKEVRVVVLGQLHPTFGAVQAEMMIDQAEGIPKANKGLRVSAVDGWCH